MVIRISNSSWLIFTVTGSKMNGAIFYDLRLSDLQDLFPSPEEFSSRKNFWLLQDMVSKMAQLEMYEMIWDGSL